MAFGDPSEPSFPRASKTSTSASANSRRSDGFTPNAGLEVLDERWIYNHLQTLNQVGNPRLNNAQLLDLLHDVGREVAACGHLGQPVVHAFRTVQPLLLNAVFNAKRPRKTVDGKGSMATPLLGQFLVAINGFIQVRNEAGLADYIALEPPFSPHYESMINELKEAYPKGNDQALENKCSQALRAAREGADGSPWTAFVKFMVQYLGYLRDVRIDVSRYLETYELLSELHQRANSALGHGILGYLILPVVIANAKLVCKLAIGLDRQPELIAHIKSAQAGGEDGGLRETLPERAANILRQAFVTCLNDRGSDLTKDGKPQGKKRGIYIIANLCLKILFQCRKTRNATQIFENIYNLSPPLSAYPKRDRVTYLYYLGRFLFQNSHFYRAQLALQYAYDLSPTRQDSVRQRRHTLIYLIASNIILGRFPSQTLLNRPEARGLSDRFLPLCYAIRQGNLAAFNHHLSLASPHATWFLHFRILLQLRNRCEPLVWRSLTRKTWILNGTRPAEGSKVAPQVDINDLVTLFNLLIRQSDTANGYVDPDFAGADFEDHSPQDLDTLGVESKLSSLIDQGLLNGFISHSKLKYAITGTARKGGNILAAGFPSIWDVLKAKAEGDEEVPGWKKESPAGGMAAGQGIRPGPGMVFNFSNMRGIGAAG